MGTGSRNYMWASGKYRDEDSTYKEILFLARLACNPLLTGVTRLENETALLLLYLEFPKYLYFSRKRPWQSPPTPKRFNFIVSRPTKPITAIHLYTLQHTLFL